MKKVLKYSSLVALGLLTAGMLAACSNSKSGTSSGKTEVKVATNASPKPFNYEENGKLTGYEIEIIRAIFKGSNKYKVKFETTEWSGIFAGLDSDRYQMAVNNISYTKADFQQIMNHLNDGKFDYKIFDKIGVETVIKNQKLDNLKVIDLPSNQQPYVYPLLAKGQDELKTFVNKRIQDLYKDGTLEKLSQKFFGGSYLPAEADVK